MMSNNRGRDDDEKEEDDDREQKRHRSDVASEEVKGDVASEDDEPLDFIISESEVDDEGNLYKSSRPPRTTSRTPHFYSFVDDQDSFVDPSFSLDVLYGVPWEFDKARKSKSIEPDQDSSNAYGKGVPNKKMSDAELWKFHFGGRMPVPGEDIFKDGFGPLPDTLVNVQKPGEDSFVGVVREVLPDGSYKVAMGSDGNGDILTALSNEIKVVPPMESDKVMILGGLSRGETGKLIRISGSKCLVRFDHPSTVQRFNMKLVAKLVQV